MVLFGENSALPHGVSGTRPLKEGDFVLFDLGVRYSGYCSDITRTMVYRTVSEQQREIYEVVRQAQEAAVLASKPGVRLGDLDKVARQMIQDAGYGDYFTHRLGHGLGMEAHESPSVHGMNEDLLRENMVITIEPGIYLPEIGGVRIEDDVWVTKEGRECLTQFPKELLVIGS
jgi:Xaa-Pro dipeptidase